MIEQKCIDCSKRAIWVILGLNLGLFLFKILFAHISHCMALFADSFESLENCIITLVVIVSLKIGSKKADARFPYGYGKVEFLVAGIMNMLLMATAIVYACISLFEIITVGPERPPGMIAVVAAVLSISVNYIAFWYGRCVGEKIASPSVLANAQMNFVDLVTSAGIIIVVIGSNLGLSLLDHIAAIIFCILIIKVTLRGLMKAVDGLMDANLPLEEQDIRKLVKDAENGDRIGDIRVRFVGRTYIVDMDVFVPSDQILDRGLEKVEKIKEILHKKRKDVSGVSVRLLANVPSN